MEILGRTIAVTAANLAALVFVATFEKAWLGVCRAVARGGHAKSYAPGPSDSVVTRPVKAIIASVLPSEASIYGEVRVPPLLQLLVGCCVIVQNLLLLLIDLDGSNPVAAVTTRAGVLAMVNTATACLFAFPEVFLIGVTQLCKPQLLWVHTLLAWIAVVEAVAHAFFAVTRLEAPLENLLNTAILALVSVASLLIVATALTPPAAFHKTPPLRLVCRTSANDYHAPITWRRIHAFGAGLFLLVLLIAHIAPAGWPVLVPVFALLAACIGWPYSRCLSAKLAQGLDWVQHLPDVPDVIRINIPLSSTRHSVTDGECFRVDGCWGRPSWNETIGQETYAVIIKPGAPSKNATVEGPFRLPIVRAFLNRSQAQIACLDADISEAFEIYHARWSAGLETRIVWLNLDGRLSRALPMFLQTENYKVFLHRIEKSSETRHILVTELAPFIHTILLGDLQSEPCVPVRVDLASPGAVAV